MECKKDIENLIKGIDEFKEKYVTYRTKTLRTILAKTLDYIKHKEEEVEGLNLVNKKLGAELCGKLQNYMRAIDEIESLCKNESCSPCKELEENSHCDECHNKIILDIINETKDD